MKRFVTGILFLLAAENVASAEFPKEIKIGEVTIECRTPAECRTLGLKCEDIPWEENAARVYVDAFNAFKVPSREFLAILTGGAQALNFGEHAEEARKHFAENKEVYALAARADEMPRYSFPIAKSRTILGIRIRQLDLFRSLSLDLRQYAAFEFTTGNRGGAFDVCLQVMRMGKRISRCNSLIEGVVGVAVQGDGLRGLHRMVGSGKATEAELKYLGERLAGFGPELPHPLEAFRAERVIALLVVADLEKFGLEGTGLGDQDPAKWRAAFKPDLVRKNITEAFDEFDQLAAKPPWIALRPDPAAGRGKEPDWDPVSASGLIPPALPVVVSYANHRVVFDCCRIQIALERFKLANRTYPKDLAALVPACLDEVPVDPYSGQAYRYRLTEKGDFVLWSVGGDLKDDGGKATDYRGPDLVFSSEEGVGNIK